MGILFFLLILSAVVAIHEFGHFIVARMCGVHVEVFSIGMGPKLLKWTDKKGTLWCLSALPIGGYVKMLGHGTKTPITEENKQMAYTSKNVYQRMAIVVAGPMINFISAMLMFACLSLAAGSVTKHDYQVTKVVAESHAKSAGIMPGDILYKVNGRIIDEAPDIIKGLVSRSFDRTTITVKRDKKELVLNMSPMVIKNGQFPKLGVHIRRINARKVEYNLPRAVSSGIEQTLDIISMSYNGLARLVGGDVPVNQLRSIIGMGDDVNTGYDQTTTQVEAENQRRVAEAVAEAEAKGTNLEAAKENVDRVSLAKERIISFFNICAFLSVAIGFMNLLPILPLDGGHLVTYIYEALTGKTLPDLVMNIYALMGLVLVLGLMLFTMTNDIIRIVERFVS
jgi:regulator of sigma E protease